MPCALRVRVEYNTCDDNGDEDGSRGPRCRPPPPKPPTEPDWPIPRFNIRIEDLAHPGAVIFFEALALKDQHNVATPLEALRYAVLATLYWLYAVPECAPTKSVSSTAYPVVTPFNQRRANPPRPPPNGRRRIHHRLRLRERDPLLLEPHREQPTPRAREEILGVLVHEVVHCYQHNARGTANGGFIEGVADFVRLRARLGAPHWKRAAPAREDRWDAGYERTAFFLDWLEARSAHGEGTIRRMNAALDGVTWYKARVFETFAGAKVGKLWRTYRVEMGGEDFEEEEEEEQPDPEPAYHPIYV
ncbi:hypothetical protein MKEN_01253600 [Mycena kentingensis (nom. inval.)]|nr:hypothetical protein MKEN_01253600 [Mycena kentingensis (nom. inval.)]